MAGADFAALRAAAVASMKEDQQDDEDDDEDDEEEEDEESVADSEDTAEESDNGGGQEKWLSDSCTANILRFFDYGWTSEDEERWQTETHRDYYASLELPKASKVTPSRVRAAYHRLAAKWHPDHGRWRSRPFNVRGKGASFGNRTEFPMPPCVGKSDPSVARDDSPGATSVSEAAQTEGTNGAAIAVSGIGIRDESADCTIADGAPVESAETQPVGANDAPAVGRAAVCADNGIETAHSLGEGDAPCARAVTTTQSQMDEAATARVLHKRGLEKGQLEQNQRKQALERFWTLTEAYLALKDEEKKRIYDECGLVGLRRSEGYAAESLFDCDAFEVYDDFFAGKDPEVRDFLLMNGGSAAYSEDEEDEDDDDDDEDTFAQEIARAANGDLGGVSEARASACAASAAAQLEAQMLPSELRGRVCDPQDSSWSALLNSALKKAPAPQRSDGACPPPQSLSSHSSNECAVAADAFGGAGSPVPTFGGAGDLDSRLCVAGAEHGKDDSMAAATTANATSQIAASAKDGLPKSSSDGVVAEHLQMERNSHVSKLRLWRGSRSIARGAAKRARITETGERVGDPSTMVAGTGTLSEVTDVLQDMSKMIIAHGTVVV